MARGRARSSSGSRAPPPPPPQRHAPPPQQHAQAAPAPASSGFGGGGLGGMLAQGAALGAGSAVGHMAINSMFGGGGGHHQQAPPPQEMQQQQQPVCQDQDQMFHRCMQTSGGDMNMCKAMYDDLAACKRQYGLM